MMKVFTSLRGGRTSQRHLHRTAFGAVQVSNPLHNLEIASSLTPFAPRNDIKFYCLLIISILLIASCASKPERRSTPTPVIAGLNTDQSSAESEATPIPTLAPFRFVLPTPGAEPVSSWRPPLYPIPWAISSYDHFYFARPIAADQINWPLADYRYGGVFFGTVVHTGVDIDAVFGTKILAAGPGTVVWADWGLFTEAPGNESDPYGRAVVIKHDFGYKGQPLYTIYAHMSKIIAIVGQHVETGDVIGLVGDTGATTGPHLHFEVRLNDNSFHTTYNPELWMAPPQGWGVLVGRIMDDKGELLNLFTVEVRPMPSQVPLRVVKTYGGGPVNADPYYHENMVLSDLPAGLYKIFLSRAHKDYQYWVDIYPGQVTYFTFREGKGFKVEAPPVPTLEALPKTPTVVP